MIIPKLGLGTYRLKGEVVEKSVKTALTQGYRAIDTAQIYENEADVGKAIAESGIDHNALFVTTKIWIDNVKRDRLIPSLKESLEKLQMDHVNLTLIHWPAPSLGVSITEMMENLMEAKVAGLTTHIGVSNFNIAQVREAMKAVGVENIATNQIELSPYLQNRKIVQFLQANNIDVTSYMTLAYGKVLNDPVLAAIAKNHHASVAQIALAWAMQLNIAVIPSSTKAENLRQNLEAMSIVLTQEEMNQITALEREGREVNPEELAPLWD